MATCIFFFLSPSSFPSLFPLLSLSLFFPFPLLSLSHMLWEFFSFLSFPPLTPPTPLTRKRMCKSLFTRRISLLLGEGRKCQYLLRLLRGGGRRGGGRGLFYFVFDCGSSCTRSGHQLPILFLSTSWILMPTSAAAGPNLLPVCSPFFSLPSPFSLPPYPHSPLVKLVVAQTQTHSTRPLCTRQHNET
jgi:hypothetical protein